MILPNNAHTHIVCKTYTLHRITHRERETNLKRTATADKEKGKEKRNQEENATHSHLDHIEQLDLRSEH